MTRSDLAVGCLLVPSTLPRQLQGQAAAAGEARCKRPARMEERAAASQQPLVAASARRSIRSSQHPLVAATARRSIRLSQQPLVAAVAHSGVAASTQRAPRCPNAPSPPPLPNNNNDDNLLSPLLPFADRRDSQRPGPRGSGRCGAAAAAPFRVAARWMRRRRQALGTCGMEPRPSQHLFARGRRVWFGKTRPARIRRLDVPPIHSRAGTRRRVPCRFRCPRALATRSAARRQF